ncbi:MAG: hypothetical protein GX220_06820 [Treponema sp.]|jgi:hypothetical protein|nr:hypothetical protein [Treponema sp.]
MAEKNIRKAKPTGNSAALRFGAIIFWILAIVAEVIGILILLGNIPTPEAYLLYFLIGAIVIDLIFVIIGSQMWKKANHIKPASEKNPLAFWLYNNLGVIVSVIAFAPLLILILLNKDADKKTKTIAAIVAAVALAIAGVSSYDFNPVSQEDLARAEAYFQNTDVFYTKNGKVYHSHADCGYLKNSKEVFEAKVSKAFEENKTRLCKSCAKKDNVTNEILAIQE